MSSDSSPTDTSLEDPSFVAQMRPALVKYFKRKTGSTAEAEDLAQDVLVRALTCTTWKVPAEARGYIFRAAVNRWRDRLRRHRVRENTIAWDDESIEQSGVENPPERVLIVEEELTQVVQALRKLPSRTRTVLMLVRMEQMRIASVANMLGISVSAVNKHLARAVAALARVRAGQLGLRK